MSFITNNFEILFNNTIRYINSFMSEDETKNILYNALKFHSNCCNVSFSDNYLEDTVNQIYEDIIKEQNAKGVEQCR